MNEYVEMVLLFLKYAWAVFYGYVRVSLYAGFLLALPAIVVGNMLMPYIGEPASLVVTFLLQLYILHYAYCFVGEGRLNRLMQFLFPWKTWAGPWWPLRSPWVARVFAAWPRWWLPKLRGLTPVKSAPSTAKTQTPVA